MADWLHTHGTDGGRSAARHSRTPPREHRPDHRADNPRSRSDQACPPAAAHRPPWRWRWAGRASARPGPTSPGRKCDQQRHILRRQRSLRRPHGRVRSRPFVERVPPPAPWLRAGPSALKRSQCHNPRRERPGPQAPDRAAHRSPHRGRPAGIGRRPRLAGRTTSNVPGPEVALPDGRVPRGHPQTPACLRTPCLGVHDRHH